MVQITWINCAEQMPPNDKTEVICTRENSIQIVNMKAMILHLNEESSISSGVLWTEFTEEKWKELNK